MGFCVVKELSFFHLPTEQHELSRLHHAGGSRVREQHGIFFFFDLQWN